MYIRFRPLSVKKLQSEIDDSKSVHEILRKNGLVRKNIYRDIYDFVFFYKKLLSVGDQL